MAHSDSFRINVSIADMHRLTARILDVSNVFKNTNVSICERYLDWFEIYDTNVPLNRDDGPFCLQYMNGIQGTKPAGRK